MAPNLWWPWLAAVAIGAIGGALGAAGRCLRDKARSRRNIRHLEAHLANPAVIARYSRKEETQ